MKTQARNYVSHAQRQFRVHQFDARIEARAGKVLEEMGFVKDETPLTPIDKLLADMQASPSLSKAMPWPAMFTLRN